MLHPNGVVVFALGQAVDMFPYPLFSCLGKTVCFLSLSTLGQIWAFLQCSVKHEITQSVSRNKMQCLFSATQPSASERAPNWENQYLGDWPFGYSAIFSSYHPPVALRGRTQFRVEKQHSRRECGACSFSLVQDENGVFVPENKWGLARKLKIYFLLFYFCYGRYITKNHLNGRI